MGEETVDALPEGLGLARLPAVLLIEQAQARATALFEAQDRQRDRGNYDVARILGELAIAETAAARSAIEAVKAFHESAVPNGDAPHA